MKNNELVFVLRIAIPCAVIISLNYLQHKNIVSLCFAVSSLVSCIIGCILLIVDVRREERNETKNNKLD